MKVLAQRVLDASCIIESETTAAIEEGLLIYVSFKKGDDSSVVPKMAEKTAKLRIFEDDAGKMNKSVLDTEGSVLAIPQFTLEASTKKGHRPSFTDALEPNKAETLFLYFVQRLKNEGLTVKTGQFQTEMAIKSTNHGPVTVMMERG
ncbi:MAG: D-aminoacyl-tRNA deacylase [Bacillota bacterium]